MYDVFKFIFKFILLVLVFKFPVSIICDGVVVFDSPRQPSRGMIIYLFVNLKFFFNSLLFSFIHIPVGFLFKRNIML